MYDPRDHHSVSSGPPPRIKSRSLNLQKCVFCRERKVKCEPKHRQWPDKCVHCERRGEECSPPRFAARRHRIRNASDTSDGSSSSQQSIIGASTVPQQEAPLGDREVICNSMSPGMVGGIELTYQQLKDIATILRCYGIEHSVQMRQSQWLKSYFHKYDNIVIKKKEYLETFSNRLRAMCHIQKLTSQHVESLLNMHKHSAGERVLMCHLLVDVEGSLSNLSSTLESLHHQDDPDFASNQQRLAALLYETGDHNGALALLHRIPFTRIDERSLQRMIQLGADLNSRMSENLDRYPLGIGDALMILDFFQDPGPLVLPYSTLATHSNSAEAKEAFIKKSFIWPWIRRKVRLDLGFDDPARKLVDWKPTYLSSQLTDSFGHTYLHAAFLSQDLDHLTAIVENIGQEGPEKDIAAQSPSYASGLTPLACSATSLGNFNAFQRILTFSAGNICCGAGSGILSHASCALSIAARCHNHPIVEALILRSAQMNVDISECCRWTTSYLYFPQIPADIWGLLVQAQK